MGGARVGREGRRRGLHPDSPVSGVRCSAGGVEWTGVRGGGLGTFVTDHRRSTNHLAISHTPRKPNHIGSATTSFTVLPTSSCPIRNPTAGDRGAARLLVTLATPLQAELLHTLLGRPRLSQTAQSQATPLAARIIALLLARAVGVGLGTRGASELDSPLGVGSHEHLQLRERVIRVPWHRSDGQTCFDLGCARGRRRMRLHRARALPRRRRG